MMNLEQPVCRSRSSALKIVLFPTLSLSTFAKFISADALNPKYWQASVRNGWVCLESSARDFMKSWLSARRFWVEHGCMLFTKKIPNSRATGNVISVLLELF